MIVSLYSAWMAIVALVINFMHIAIKCFFSSELITWISRFLLKKLRGGAREVPKHLPPLENCEKVSERCYRILGLNPGPHTLHGTNTYILGSGKTRILVDTGELDTSEEWVDLLLNKVMPDIGVTSISHVLLTHGHYDHLGGVALLLHEMARRKMALPHLYKRRITADDTGEGPECGNYPANFACFHLKNGHEFVVRDTSSGLLTTLSCMYTPGHTDDSVCFAVLEDFAVLSGDSVLGCGTSVFDDLHAYMLSLAAIRQLMLCQPTAANVGLKTTGSRESSSCVAIHTLYPGHGPIVRQNGLKHIDAYIENRSNRERQLCAILSAQPGRVFSSLELVSFVYGSLPWVVHFSAQRNLVQHLNKLRREGQVQQSFGQRIDLWNWNEDKLS